MMKVRLAARHLDLRHSGKVSAWTCAGYGVQMAKQQSGSLSKYFPHHSKWNSRYRMRTITDRTESNELPQLWSRLMSVRIAKGLPRGGLGYLGVVPAAVAVIGAFKFAIPDTLGITIGCSALSLWLGLGLRQDGDSGEKIDLVILPNREDTVMEWLLGANDDTVFRISTLIMLGATG